MVGPLVMPFDFPQQQLSGAAIYAAIANRVGITQVLFVSRRTRRVTFIAEHPMFYDIKAVVIVCHIADSERLEQCLPSIVLARYAAQSMDKRG